MNGRRSNVGGIKCNKAALKTSSNTRRTMQKCGGGGALGKEGNGQLDLRTERRTYERTPPLIEMQLTTILS